MASSSFPLEDHFDRMTIKYIQEAEGHDMEYKYSRFWQRYIGRNFQGEEWQLVCEQAPHDDSRLRMDYKVEYYNAHENTISPVVFVEVKRPGGSVRVLEQQGLAVAKEAINTYGMTGIYVLTLWGLKFRPWYVERRRQALEPVFGSIEAADKNWYLGITTPNGIHEFEETIHLIKNEPPQQQAPVVPSQQAEMERMLQPGDYYQNEDSVTGGQYEWQSQPTMQPWPQFTTQVQASPAPWGQFTIDSQEVPDMQSTQFGTHGGKTPAWTPGQEDVNRDAMQRDDNPEQHNEDSEAEIEGKGKSKQKTKERIKVKVKLVSHKSREDEYFFDRLDGSERGSLFTDWKEKFHNGQRVQKSRGKDAIYWSSHKGRRSGQFRYCSHTEVRDQTGNVIYNQCVGHCAHPGGLALGYHVSCRRLLDPASLDSLLRINTYSFEPLNHQKKTRYNRIRDELAPELRTSLPLPMEVVTDIASKLLREYAVAKNNSLFGDRKAFESSVNLTSAMIQSYDSFEGEEYLSSLTNPTELDTACDPPKVIYIGEDHLGIRKFILSDSPDNPDIDYISGVWWKAILVGESTTLKFYSDVRAPSVKYYQYTADQIFKGVKIRHLIYFDRSGVQSTKDVHSFSIAQHPKNLHRHYPFHQVRSQTPPRLSVFRYNHPDITGFSICCDPAPIALHAHTVDEDFSFYQSVSEDSVWIYMPLEKNERIVRIWMRARRRLSRELALAFETDKGHTKLFGAQPTPALLSCRWILLDAPQGQPGHFFFDGDQHGIRWLSLDSQPPIPALPPALPTASSPHPLLVSNDGFIWSCASVQDIVKVSICRRNTGDRIEVMGLLFCYADGKEASVGQVRLDCLDEQQTIDHTQSLYLGFTRSKKGTPYISKVRVSALQQDDSVAMWFKVSWGGLLEWWLSYRQCQVYQDGRQSLPMSF